MSNKEKWAKLQEFQNENKEFLILSANPVDDSILVSFGGLNVFVKFPGKDMEQGVIFNALRKSAFEDSIDAFMSGIMKATGISDKEDGGEVLKVLGGAIKAIGENREIIKNKATKNVKSKSTGK